MYPERSFEFHFSIFSFLFFSALGLYPWNYEDYLQRVANNGYIVIAFAGCDEGDLKYQVMLDKSKQSQIKVSCLVASNWAKITDFNIKNA